MSNRFSVSLADGLASPQGKAHGCAAACPAPAAFGIEIFDDALPPDSERLRFACAAERTRPADQKRSSGCLPQEEEGRSGGGWSFDLWFDGNPLPMMIFDRQSLAIQAVNESAVRLYGYAREDFLGMNIADIRSREDIPDLLRALQAGDRDIRGPFAGRHRKKDGTFFNVEVHSQRRELKARTTVLAQIRDLTGRSRSAAPLESGEQPFRLFFESSPDAILVTDSTGKITELNGHLAGLFGYRRPELLGQSIEILIPERFQHAHVAHRRDFADAPRMRTMGAGLGLYGRRKDGSEFRVDVLLGPIETPGGPCVLSVIRDISERKQAEEALLPELSGVLLANLDITKLLSAISSGIRKVVPHDFATLAFHDAGSDRLRLQLLDTAYEKDMPAQEILVPIEGSAPGWVFRRREPLLLPTLETDRFARRTLQHLIGAGLKSGCWLPLVSHDRTLGIMAVASRRERAFGEKDVGLLSQITNQVALAVDNALAMRRMTELRDRLRQEKNYLEEELQTLCSFEEIVGQSRGLTRILKQVETVAPTDSTVLILGETGTGKELIARAIHQLSGRRERTFVKLNCAAIPSGLLESELFGHEKGAFTGAISQKIGLMELAHQGTLFLDEVGDLPLELQPKLLRALQEREFQRLGSTRTLPVNVRLVAATNHDLAKMIVDRKFRIELYYRLKVFPIAIPALRERPEDIPMLVRHFVDKHARRMGKHIETIPQEILEALTRWRWPGNVRELENFMERAVILSDGSVLRVPLTELQAGSEPVTPADHMTLKAAEREHIVEALRATQGVVGGPQGAAARLGVKRTTLISKMKKLGIEPSA